jgi:hypothetical protein
VTEEPSISTLNPVKLPSDPEVMVIWVATGWVYGKTALYTVPVGLVMLRLGGVAAGGGAAYAALEKSAAIAAALAREERKLRMSHLLNS